MAKDPTHTTAMLSKMPSLGSSNEEVEGGWKKKHLSEHTTIQIVAYPFLKYAVAKPPERYDRHSDKSDKGCFSQGETGRRVSLCESTHSAIDPQPLKLGFIAGLLRIYCRAMWTHIVFQGYSSSRNGTQQIKIGETAKEISFFFGSLSCSSQASREYGFREFQSGLIGEGCKREGEMKHPPARCQIQS